VTRRHSGDTRRRTQRGAMRTPITTTHLNNMPLLRAARAARTFLLMLLTVGLLAACGGGDDDDDGNARVRFVNATADAASLDLTIEDIDDDDSERVLFTAIERDLQSDYSEVGDASYRLRLKRSGASSSLAVGSGTFDGDERYTVFAYGREGDYRVFSALDDEDEPDGGKAKVRVFNAAPDAGALDVYVTESGASLDDTVATVANVGGATLGFYNTIDRGTYRVRVTGVNDKDDVRLDVDGIELADRARVTFVLQPGPGGVLVNALVSQYRGDIAALKNPYARARLVAGASGNAAVTTTLGSVSLNVNLRSPSLGSYTLVPAGTVAAAINVNATTQLSGDVALAAGGDYTIAVYGEAASPQWQVFVDDNRPPVDSQRAKLRLLHLASNVAANLTLSADFVGVASDVPYGQASDYKQVSVATDARLEVTSPLSVTPLYLDEEVDLPSKSVFNVFMLGGGSAPTGILRRER
jgi:hypothetical protein